MPGPWIRTVAVLCYIGALRVPLVAWVAPEWAFTIPSGAVVAALAWAYGRKRSNFLLHHAREGVRWSLQSNLVLAAMALISKGWYYASRYTGLSAFDGLWHFTAVAVRWAGGLVTVLTLFVMIKAARGQTGDALTI